MTKGILKLTGDGGIQSFIYLFIHSKICMEHRCVPGARTLQCQARLLSSLNLLSNRQVTVQLRYTQLRSVK